MQKSIFDDKLCGLKANLFTCAKNAEHFDCYIDNVLQIKAVKRFLPTSAATPNDKFFTLLRIVSFSRAFRKSRPCDVILTLAPFAGVGIVNCCPTKKQTPSSSISFVSLAKKKCPTNLLLKEEVSLVISCIFFASYNG